MKKILFTLAIVICGFGAANAGSSFGQPVAAAGEDEVSAKVLGAFKKEFSAAREISWTIGSNYYQASFVYNDQHVSAYYNTDGELIGLTRNISPVDLPLALQSDLKKNHSEYWISDLFEVANENGTTYYITLEDADSSLVMKSANAKNWDTYKKVKKS